jgi:arsenate reductase
VKDVSIDISNQKPKEMTEDMIRNAIKIVNMGCMDKNFCPTLFVHNALLHDYFNRYLLAFC